MNRLASAFRQTFRQCMTLAAVLIEEIQDNVATNSAFPLSSEPITHILDVLEEDSGEVRDWVNEASSSRAWSASSGVERKNVLTAPSALQGMKVIAGSIFYSRPVYTLARSIHKLAQPRRKVPGICHILMRRPLD